MVSAVTSLLGGPGFYSFLWSSHVLPVPVLPVKPASRSVYGRADWLHVTFRLPVQSVCICQRPRVSASSQPMSWDGLETLIRTNH